MKPGVDINICRKFNCPNCCKINYTCLFIHNGFMSNWSCPIPNKCLYKSIQLLLSKRTLCSGYEEFKWCAGCNYTEINI